MGEGDRGRCKRWYRVWARSGWGWRVDGVGDDIRRLGVEESGRGNGR